MNNFVKSIRLKFLIDLIKTPLQELIYSNLDQNPWNLIKRFKTFIYIMEN